MRQVATLIMSAAVLTIPLVGSTAQAVTPRMGPDFTTCPESGPVPEYPAAPPAPSGPYVPAGTEVQVPTAQINDGAYQTAPVQVGSQVFQTILDTGSSWMVINSGAIAGNTEIEVTGEVAAISYGGGVACSVGRVARGPVSIGGLEPRDVTFLIADTGNVPFLAIIGLNTWDPVSTKLDVPMNALGIDTFEFTLPMSTDTSDTGLLVLNGQPTIDAASPRRVAGFANQALEGGNRIYVPGSVSAGGASTRGPLMLDSGTPFTDLAFFPRAAAALGYDFATGMWSKPSATPTVAPRPTGGGAFTLNPTAPPAPLAQVIAITPEQTTRPEAGIIGLAGTAVVVGADYIRPWVLGVRFTNEGSEIRLLARDRAPAVRENCAGMAPTRIKERGRTLLVPRACRVNGEQVKVTTQGGSGGYRLVTQRGATWIVTSKGFTRAKITFTAPPYLTHNRLQIQREYRR